MDEVSCGFLSCRKICTKDFKKIILCLYNLHFSHIFLALTDGKSDCQKKMSFALENLYKNTPSILCSCLEKVKFPKSNTD